MHSIFLNNTEKVLDLHGPIVRQISAVDSVSHPVTSEASSKKIINLTNAYLIVLGLRFLAISGSIGPATCLNASTASVMLSGVAETTFIPAYLRGNECTWIVDAEISVHDGITKSINYS